MHTTWFAGLFGSRSRPELGVIAPPAQVSLPVPATQAPLPVSAIGALFSARNTDQGHDETYAGSAQRHVTVSDTDTVNVTIAGDPVLPTLSEMHQQIVHDPQLL